MRIYTLRWKKFCCKFWTQNFFEWVWVKSLFGMCQLQELYRAGMLLINWKKNIMKLEFASFKRLTSHGAQSDSISTSPESDSLSCRPELLRRRKVSWIYCIYWYRKQSPATIKFMSEIEWKLSSFHIQHVETRTFDFRAIWKHIIEKWISTSSSTIESNKIVGIYFKV